MTTSTRVLVIGGGLVGAASAWRLAAPGHRVTMLEQFALGHQHGASHGSSRIFRHAYADPTYVELAARALQGWRRLERITGLEILERTGAVDHGDPAAIQQLSRSLHRAGLEFQIVAPRDAERRWPGIRFDTVVSATRRPVDCMPNALSARCGGRRGCPAWRSGRAQRYGDIRSSASGVEVALDDDILRPDHLVVAGGAWTSGLLPEQSVQWTTHCGASATGSQGGLTDIQSRTGGRLHR